jgi:predicted ferric reductase/Ca2+-binding EF-hand superfamily protein
MLSADELDEIEADAGGDLEGQSPELDIKRKAREIFAAWDLGGDGLITVEEIVLCSGLDEKFAVSLGRVLSLHNGDDTVDLQSLTDCIRVLRMGTKEEKVRLLFTFMDSDKSGSIDYSEAKQFLKMVGEQGLAKLGFVDNGGGGKRSITYEDMLMLFQNSGRGDAAIGIFCDQVMQILGTKKTVKRGVSGYFARPDDAIVTCSSTTLSAVKEVIGNNASKEKLFLYGLVLLQIMFWLINFFYYKGRSMALSFCIAKGFGLNLRVITLAMYFTMMRRTMGILYSFSLLQPFIPMGFNIQVHSFLGFSMVFHALGHMCGHIAYHEIHWHAGFDGLFTQKSLLRDSPWSQRGKGDAITGYILMGILFLMAGTALYRGKGSEHYRRFFLTHYLYNAWPVFIFLHVPDLWPYFLAITGAFVLERAYDFFYMTFFSTLESSRACSNGVTFLSVPRRRETYPGSYYRIKVPAISKTEWHPFSLASGVNSHHLTFFVASSGDWTKALYKIVADEELRKSTMVMVQGPFYAPAKSATKFSTNVTLLVASGIGITPFFSVMATKVADELSYEGDKDIYASLFKEDVTHRGSSISTTKAIKNMSLSTPSVVNEELEELRVVWMIRDCGELLFYLDYVHQLVKTQSSLSRHVVYVDVYLTGLGKTSDPVYMVAQTLFMLTVSDLTSKYMNIHFGRPEMARIFKGITPNQVYYCGGTLMQNVLTKLCREVGAKFHPEDFDAGTTFVQSIEKFFTVRQKEAARVAVKREVLKRRLSMSDLNAAPGLSPARPPSATYEAAPAADKEESTAPPGVQPGDHAEEKKDTAAPPAFNELSV